MTNDLTLEQREIAGKVAKLLNLAAKAGTEEEAAAATAKANELMIKYNLEAAAVEKSGDAKREEIKTDGGFYAFQRSLWQSVAELNFCLYWTQMYRAEATRYVDIYTGAKSMAPGPNKERRKVPVLKYRHRLVGRTVNTRTAIAMGEYLQQVIERIVNESIKADDLDKSGHYANSFRRGVADAIIEKVEDRRSEYLREERKKQQAAAEQGGRGDGTSLSLQVYIDKETDANNDFLYGEGWSAEQARKQQAAAVERKRKLEEYARWAAAHPEEAKAKEEEARKEARKYRGRSSYRSSSDNIDYSAYYRGKKAGASVSIDPQVRDKAPPAKKLTGPKAIHL